MNRVRDHAQHEMRRGAGAAQVDDVDVEHRPDERAISGKAAFPQAAAEDDRAGPSILRYERAAGHARGAEDLEELGCDQQPVQPLAERTAGQIDGSPSIPRDCCERRRARLPFQQIRRRDEPGVRVA